MSDSLKFDMGTQNVPTHIPETEAKRAYKDVLQAWNAFSKVVRSGEMDYPLMALIAERLRVLGIAIEGESD